MVPTEYKGLLTRAVEKSLIPIITEMLKGSSFCLFFSSSKTFLVSKLIDVAIRHLHKSSSLKVKIKDLISTAIKNSLDRIAIPILKRNFKDNECAAISIKFASTFLIKILQRALCNVIIYWFPLIPLDSSEGENSLHFVLNFINDKFLIILSSLDNNESLVAKTLFAPVWNALIRDQRKIIESPSLILLTMPLRAAAHAYQLMD